MIHDVAQFAFPLLLGAAAGDAARPLLLDLLIVLSTAAAVALAMQRLRLAVIPGYLLAGVVVGPHALGLVGSAESLEAISRLAVILLLFGIGLQLELTVLRHGALRSVAAGLMTCALTVLLGWRVAMAFDMSAPVALAVCMALSLSSTAVVLRLLWERGEHHTPIGRISFAILVIQDLLVVAMLALLPLIARWAGAAPAGQLEPWPGLTVLLTRSLVRIAGVAALILVGQWILPRILHEAARSRSQEVMIICCVAAALGAGGAMQLMGFSAEMGAFLAGLILSATPLRHQLLGQIVPLRDLFLAVFFTTIGMTVDVAALGSPAPILVGCASLMLIKAAVITAVLWALGFSSGVAVCTGLALAQAGEFSIVLIERARDLAMIGDVLAGQLVAAVVLSLIVTPLFVAAGFRLARRPLPLGPAPWVRRLARIGLAEDDEPPRRHVIIAGYGPVGRCVAEQLDKTGIDYTIVDINPKTVETQVRLGKRAVYGDITNPAVLESAGIHRAEALILTIPDEEAALRACYVARRLAPDVLIVARTNYLSKGMLATELGADHVTVEELATAEAMRQIVLEHLGADGTPEPSPDARAPGSLSAR